MNFWRPIIALLYLFWGWGIVRGQESSPPANLDLSGLVEARFSVIEPMNLTIGTPLEVRFEINLPSGYELVEAPSFPIEDDIFELVNTTEPQRFSRQQGEIVQQIHTIRIWRPGSWVLRETFAQVRTSRGQLVSIPVASASFFVVSALAGQSDLGLRPNLDVVDFSITPWWVVGLTVSTVILLISILVWGGWRIMRRISQAVIPTSAQLAIAQLEDLRNQQLPAEIVVALISDVLRTYMDARFELSARDKTTQEINELLNQQDNLPRELRSGLINLLEQSDLVKFAQYELKREQSERMLSYAIRWVRACERHILNMKKSAPS